MAIESEKWQAGKENQRYADRINADISAKVTVEERPMSDVDYARNIIRALSKANLVNQCGTKLVGGLKYADLITPNKQLELKADEAPERQQLPPTRKERLDFLRPSDATDIEPEPESPTGFAAYQKQWKDGKLK